MVILDLFSQLEDEPTDLLVGSLIDYNNGSHVCLGNILQIKKDGLNRRYLVRATRDTPDGYAFGYSEQWIYEFQILI